LPASPGRRWRMRFVSGRVRGRLLPPVSSAVVLLLAIGAANVAAAPNPASVRDPVASLRVFYRSPVLVRSGERVQIPVDVGCATRSGRACSAATTIAVQSGARPMRATSTADPSGGLDLSRVHGPSNRGLPFSIRAAPGLRTV